MRTVRLGKSELETSRLAYGCWRLAGLSKGTAPPSDEGAPGKQAVIAAYEAGYTLFDHADIYANGLAESLFGEVLREVEGMRERILIATKCGIRRAGDPDALAPYRYDFSAEYISRSCEASLKRLGIETIDLYQLHRPDILCDPEEVARAFDELKSSGKVREFGVSNFKPSQLTMLQRACPMPLIVNQVEIGLCQIGPFNDGTLDQCLTEGITPMAWSPLAGGRLATREGVEMQDPDHARKVAIHETLDAIARDREVKRTVVALAWLCRHPSRIVPIVGTTNPDHIRSSSQAADLELTREEWYRLYEAAGETRLP